MCLCPNSWKLPKGFTLAELLIALLILGEIATFTIPKIITAQANGRNNAVAKEAISMVAGSYQLFQLKNTVTSYTTGGDLSQYMNYVKVDTSSSIDDLQTFTTTSCTNSKPCLVLQSGARLQLDWSSFGGTSSTNVIAFMIDPDGGVTDGTTNGPGKSLEFFLYYSGRISTFSTITTGTVNYANWPGGPDTTKDPPWFSW